MKKLTLFIALAMACATAYCQIEERTDEEKAAIQFFYQKIGESNFLNNGREYERYPFKTNGHAFYVHDMFKPGTVVYDGITYKVNLLYDIEKDAVVVPSVKDPNFLIALVPEKISAFTIGDDKFVRLDEAAGMKAGFYKISYDGVLKLYSRIEKHREEDVLNNIRITFKQNIFYYILRDHVFFRADKRRDAVNALKDKEKEIQRYIRKNNLDFGEKKEDTLAELLSYYEQITITK